MFRNLLILLFIFVSTLASAQQEWQPLANGLMPRIEGVSAVVDNKLYVFGGFYNGRLQVTETAEVYDPQTNTWAQLASMPLPGTHFGFEVVEKTVWLVGGFLGDNPGTSTDQVQIYDILTNTWRIGPALPAARAAGALVRHGTNLHYFGGLLPDRNTDVADHYVLDLNAPDKGWKTASPLPEPRNHLSAALVNGKIYAIGGQKLHDRASRHDVSFVHEYNPVTDTWRRLADMPIPRSHFEPGTTVYNNKIIIVGGRINNDPYTDAVTQYDPATDTWQDMEPIPVAMLAPVGKVINNNLYVSHGRSSRGPESKAWSWRLPSVVTTLPQAGALQALQVDVYPVPARGKFTVTVTAPSSSWLTAELVDNTGRIAHKLDHKQLTTNFPLHYEIVTTSLRPGLYLLRLHIDGQMVSKKVIIE